MPRKMNPKKGNQPGALSARDNPTNTTNGTNQEIHPIGKTKAQIQKRSFQKSNLKVFNGFDVSIRKFS
jgi:hypothetical protein